jgi:hypothetical protein
LLKQTKGTAEDLVRNLREGNFGHEDYNLSFEDSDENMDFQDVSDDFNLEEARQ